MTPWAFLLIFGRLTGFAIILFLSITHSVSQFHIGPPAILRTPRTDTGRDMREGLRRNRMEADLVLRWRYPPGSSAARMKAALLDEGFAPLDPLPSHAARPGEIANWETANWETGRTDFDVAQRTLLYRWIGDPQEPFGCSTYMRVNWAEDPAGRISRIEGVVGRSCTSHRDLRSFKGV
jgi:hypothetical protein